MTCPQLPEVAPPRLAARDWAEAAAAALLAGALRWLCADFRGFWLDEYYTLRAAMLPWREMISERLYNGHSPLYFFYARCGFWLGSGERSLRATSALAVCAAVLMITGLAGELGLRRRLRALWGLAILQPYWVTVGIEYRYMMPLIALSAGACWAAAVYSRRADAASGIGLAAAIGLILWTHGSALFVSGGIFAFLVWQGAADAGRLRLRDCLAAWPVAAGVTSSLPLVYWVSGQIRDTPPRGPNGMALLKNYCRLAFGDYKLWPSELGIAPYPLLWAMLAALAISIFLARRRLRAEGGARAWRMIASLLAGIPLACALFSATVSNVQGTTRYMAALTLPTLLAMAAAWDAPIAPRLRWSYRAWLGALLAIQLPAVCVNRGDRHRETVRWVLERESGEEPIVVSSALNAVAFQYLGLARAELVHPLDRARTKNGDVAGQIKAAFGGARRGFVFAYHNHIGLDDAARDLRREGYFAGLREWDVGGVIEVFAAIRDGADQAWLDAIPPPPRLWGPASGDD